MGVDEVVRLILAKPGKFGVIGYSRVAPSLRASAARSSTAGSSPAARMPSGFTHSARPHRRPGSTFHQGNNLPWGGGIVKSDPIGGFTAPGIDPIDWFDYALPNDIYANANPPDSYLESGYDAVKDMSLVDPLGWGRVGHPVGYRRRPGRGRRRLHQPAGPGAQDSQHRRGRAAIRRQPHPLRHRPDQAGLDRDHPLGQPPQLLGVRAADRPQHKRAAPPHIQTVCGGRPLRVSGVSYPPIERRNATKRRRSGHARGLQP